MLKVVAACLEVDGKILIAQRSKGEFEGLWEFPGGKVERDESDEEALIREMKEELGIVVEVKEFIELSKYTYPLFEVEIYLYHVFKLSGDAVINVHNQIQWVSKDHLLDYDWIPADIPLVEKVRG